jgi:hypothetical protein
MGSWGQWNSGGLNGYQQQLQEAIYSFSFPNTVANEMVQHFTGKSCHDPRGARKLLGKLSE